MGRFNSRIDTGNPDGTGLGSETNVRPGQCLESAGNKDRAAGVVTTQELVFLHGNAAFHELDMRTRSPIATCFMTVSPLFRLLQSA